METVFIVLILLCVAVFGVVFAIKRTKTVSTEIPLGNDKTDTFTIIGQLPEKIRDRVVLRDGILHISDDLRGDIDLDFLVSKLRRRGIFTYEMHKPSEFDAEYARYTMRNSKGDNEIQQMAIELMARAYTSGASDIHIVDNGSFVHIKFRRLGMICEDSQVDTESGKRMIRVIYGTLGQSANSAGGFNPLERLDARVVKRDYLPEGVHSVRIHTEPIECLQYSTGTFMALRLLYDNTSAQGTLVQRLEVLGFAKEQCEIIDKLTRRKGLMLISGPTGHGKSTALKHIMESMTEFQPERSYLSVEDPPEYPLKGVYQIQVNTKAQSGGLDERAEAYREAIAGAMRADPDVIMIGEIRYSEAAFAAIQVAQTGHAVWATVHASNAFGIVNRLETMLRAANVRDPLSMICDANVLAGLEYQCLVPKLCPHCKRHLYEVLHTEECDAVLPATTLSSLYRVILPHEIDGIYVRGTGCEHCHGGGFSGQTVVAETIDLDASMLSLLRAGKTPEAIAYWKNERGGVTYIESARRLIVQGVLDPLETTGRMGVELDADKYNDQRGAV